MKLGDVVVLLLGLHVVAGAIPNSGENKVFMRPRDASWPGDLNAGSVVTSNESDSENETDITVIMSGGTLRNWNSPGDNRVRPTPKEDIEQSDITTEIGITVSKHVCEFGQVYDSEVHSCRPNCSEGETFYAAIQECLPTKDYNKIRNRPLCKNITVNSEEFTVEPNGTVRVKSTGVMFANGTYTSVTDGIDVCYPTSPQFIKCKRWGLDPGEYELKNHGLNMWVKTYNHLYEAGDFYLRNSTDVLAVVCVRKPTAASNSAETAQVVDMYAAAWTISAVSMFVSIVIYLLTQKLKYHTKTLLCHMLSLLVFYVILITRAWTPAPQPALCALCGILLNVTFLASFFWLNVLAYDIWKRLPSYQPQGLKPRSRFPVFLVASAYAWGMSLGIAGSAVAVNYLTPRDNPFNPQFSIECWLSSQYARLVFMYVPAALLLASNFVFFVLTVINLRSIGRDAALVNRRIHKQLFKMYLKLMVVMGLCWIMEIVSAVVGKYGRYWYFTDMINCLQGFFIFVIYVCKRSILRDIIQKWEKRFGPCICRKFSSIIFSTQPHIHHSQHREARRDNSSSASICPTSDYSMNSTTSTRMSTASAVSN